MQLTTALSIRSRLRQWRLRCGGMTLMELTASMIILLVIIGVTLFSSISMDRSAAMIDTQYALGDEVSRQAEIVKALPISTLMALTPIPGTSGIGDSIAYTSTNVAPLNGFIVSSRDAEGKEVVLQPTVKWIRSRRSVAVGSADMGSMYDEVLIAATTKRAGALLTNWTLVTRLFDSAQ